MRKSLLLVAVLGTLATSQVVMAEEAAKAAETAPYTVAYNVGLFSQYIFRGLTQTKEDPALQGGVDFTHSSGFYLGAWGSNISWLEDAGNYDRSSLELDLYGGYSNTIGDITYNIGALQYYYPGKQNKGMRDSGFKRAETTEVYGSLAYKWLSAKVSVVASNGAWGYDNADGTYYAELNANYPIGESGLTVVGHVGRQEFTGKTGTTKNDIYSYTDYKIGLTKAWANGVSVGGYYTGTNADSAEYKLGNSGFDISKDQLTAFVQKTF